MDCICRTRFSGYGSTVIIMIFNAHCLIPNNPFVVGRYVSDHYFCDRRSESEYLVKQIINGRNVALISPRRMGKTGLIQHCFNQEALASDYYIFFVDIYATGSLSEFVYLLAKAIFEQLKPRKTAWSEHFFQIIASLRVGFKLDAMTGEPEFDMGLGDIPEDAYTGFAVSLFEERDKHIDISVVENVYRRFSGCTWFVQMMMNEFFSITPVGRRCGMEKVSPC